ncbi:MAG: hypothetical protein WC043_09950 [Pseudobdellovibrionaceae bacterium]
MEEEKKSQLDIKTEGETVKISFPLFTKFSRNPKPEIIGSITLSLLIIIADIFSRNLPEDSTTTFFLNDYSIYGECLVWGFLLARIQAYKMSKTRRMTLSIDSQALSITRNDTLRIGKASMPWKYIKKFELIIPALQPHKSKIKMHLIRGKYNIGLGLTKRDLTTLHTLLQLKLNSKPRQ